MLTLIVYLVWKILVVIPDSPHTQETYDTDDHTDMISPLCFKIYIHDISFFFQQLWFLGHNYRHLGDRV
jgi:hypothetical protein